jgi:hypothetical protein
MFSELAKPFNLDIFLQDESTTQEVLLLVLKQSFWSGRTGAETTIGRKELTALPTISRSAEDFTFRAF